MFCENSIQGLVQYRQNYHKIHLFSAVLSLGMEQGTQTQLSRFLDYIPAKLFFHLSTNKVRFPRLRELKKSHVHWEGMNRLYGEHIGPCQFLSQ